MKHIGATPTKTAHKSGAKVVVIVLMALCLPGLWFSFGLVQAASPITSSGLNTQVSAPLPLASGQTQFNITGGTRPGGGTHLFHSFGNFNVPTNNIANFLNSGSINQNGTLLPPNLPTANILGRINGGTPSSIFGMIQTNGPGGFPTANLFLMNPNGFLFGPTATINVGGMVAFTTADYLRLADGALFNAIPHPAADALLSAAPVAAFGFLGSNPGAITVQGSQLTVANGTGMSLVGGTITIQSGTPEGGTAQPARLVAPNGKIQLASAASPGEFDAATLQPLPNVNGASFTSFGSVNLAPGSTINVSGEQTVSIRGGQFVLSVNDAVLSTAQSPGPPDTISLSPGSSILSSNAGSRGWRGCAAPRLERAAGRGLHPESDHRRWGRGDHLDHRRARWRTDLQSGRQCPDQRRTDPNSESGAGNGRKYSDHFQQPVHDRWRPHRYPARSQSVDSGTTGRWHDRDHGD